MATFDLNLEYALLCKHFQNLRIFDAQINQNLSIDLIPPCYTDTSTDNDHHKMSEKITKKSKAVRFAHEVVALPTAVAEAEEHIARKTSAVQRHPYHILEDSNDGSKAEHGKTTSTLAVAENAFAALHVDEHQGGETPEAIGASSTQTNDKTSPTSSSPANAATHVDRASSKSSSPNTDCAPKRKKAQPLSPTTTPWTPTATFMDLSTEIRLMIYYHLLVPKGRYHISTGNCYGSINLLSCSPYIINTFDTSILRVNRTTYREALPILFQRGIFVLQLDYKHPRQLTYQAGAILNRGEVVKAIRTLVITLHLADITGVRDSRTDESSALRPMFGSAGFSSLYLHLNTTLPNLKNLKLHIDVYPDVESQQYTTDALNHLARLVAYLDNLDITITCHAVTVNDQISQKSLERFERHLTARTVRWLNGLARIEDKNLFFRPAIVNRRNAGMRCSRKEADLLSWLPGLPLPTKTRPREARDHSKAPDIEKRDHNPEVKKPKQEPCTRSKVHVPVRGSRFFSGGKVVS